MSSFQVRDILGDGRGSNILGVVVMDFRAWLYMINVCMFGLGHFGILIGHWDGCMTISALHIPHIHVETERCNSWSEFKYVHLEAMGVFI